MQGYKDKTFLYYFPKNSVVWKIPAALKVFIYILLNLFVLINHFYLANVLISLFIAVILLLVGFVSYRKTLFKLLGISLSLFFLISLILEIIHAKISLTDFDMLMEASAYVSGFFSKWLLINLSGLLMFTTLSQEESIGLLLKMKIDFRVIIPITIAFNLISRLIETLEEINISLNSRGIRGRGLFIIFNKIKYVFVAMLLDNIEYISSLRATYAFDYVEIKETYGK